MRCHRGRVSENQHLSGIVLILTGFHRFGKRFESQLLTFRRHFEFFNAQLFRSSAVLFYSTIKIPSISYVHLCLASK